MKTFRLELAGTITRDIVWRECDAETEAEAREIVAREMPTYRLRAIAEVPVGPYFAKPDFTPTGE